MFRFARRHMTPQTIVRKPWRAHSDAEKSVDFEFDIHWLRYRRRYIGNCAYFQKALLVTVLFGRAPPERYSLAAPFGSVLPVIP